jgi:hypothetical protein
MTQVKAGILGLHSNHDHRRLGTPAVKDTSSAWLLWQQELQDEAHLQNRVDARWDFAFSDDYHKSHRVARDRKPRWDEVIDSERIDVLDPVLKH